MDYLLVIYKKALNNMRQDRLEDINEKFFAMVSQKHKK